MADSGPIIVTGAAGFIGSHLCERLLAMGRRVVGVDNFDPFYDPAIKRTNIAEIRRSAERLRASFELVEFDLAETAPTRALFERVKPEGVIHLAAKAGVRPSIADPAAYARANVVATAVVLEESRRAGAPRVVVASSSSVYGNASRVPFTEDDPVNEPVSPYAATKRANELQCHTHWHLTKMPTACLRFFTVYGPRQRPDLAISTFLGKISRREDISVFGDGSSSRDYTYIDDIVSGVVASYERIDQHGYRVWNLGGSAPVRLDEMLATISRVVGHEPKITRLPMQPGDVLRTWADLSRSSRELGYSPTTGFEDGVRKQWEWMRKS
ncbi:MAG: GDP-mannose 4,6-dehydratase [Phycisphaerales bacterium]|jgi:UDP-glucuronate 4-epimerase|nr:GDP-mannose 4,6-dehydratase [Phycisphaerales bacterium]